MDVSVELSNGESIILETFSCPEVYDEDLLKEEIAEKLKNDGYDITFYMIMMDGPP